MRNGARTGAEHQHTRGVIQPLGMFLYQECSYVRIIPNRYPQITDFEYFVNNLLTEQGFDGKIRVWGYVKVTFLCSSPEKSFLKYIAGVISSVICCFGCSYRKAAGTVIPLLPFLPVYLKKEIYYFPMILFR